MEVLRTPIDYMAIPNLVFITPLDYVVVLDIVLKIPLDYMEIPIYSP